MDINPMRGVLLCVLLLLVGCGPEPTPFPVDLPTTPTATASIVLTEAQKPLARYALAPETAGLIPDLALIENSAQIIPLRVPVTPADLGILYDVVVTYGLYPDWTPAPFTPQVALIINPAALPDSTLPSLVRRSLRPQELNDLYPGVTTSTFAPESPRTLRTELANRGLPDGIELTLADTTLPGTEQLTAQMREAGLFARRVAMTTNEARTALDAGRVQLALVIWTEESEHAAWTAHYGEENVIALYTLPVSYRVTPDWEVTFTPAGFPLVR